MISRPVASRDGQGSGGFGFAHRRAIGGGDSRDPTALESLSRRSSFPYQAEYLAVPDGDAPANGTWLRDALSLNRCGGPVHGRYGVLSTTLDRDGRGHAWVPTRREGDGGPRFVSLSLARLLTDRNVIGASLPTSPRESAGKPVRSEPRRCRPHDHGVRYGSGSRIVQNSPLDSSAADRSREICGYEVSSNSPLDRLRTALSVVSELDR